MHKPIKAEKMSLSLQVVDILKSRSDISDLDFDTETQQVYFEGGPESFDDCIFDECSDEFCKNLLLSFIKKEVDMGWCVSIELSKLLSKRGDLVSEVVEPVVTRPTELGFSDTFLFLSYFGNSTIWESNCISLLDVVPEDSRDGLFIACFKLNTSAIYKKLIAKFEEWLRDPDWKSSSGEFSSLNQFLKNGMKRQNLLCTKN